MATEPRQILAFSHWSVGGARAATVWTDSSSAELIQAAVPPSVQLGLTVLYTVLYSLLFVFVYLQLWLVLHYGHKRFSYQSVFLFLCLLWSALRTTLFSFYFKNVVQANQLQPLPFWLLYCFPVCLQFFTLCLLNLYFAQVTSAYCHTGKLLCLRHLETFIIFMILGQEHSWRSSVSVQIPLLGHNSAAHRTV
uniref:G protein-coupled receptor 137c n=1 Tax=Sinocyclocheilus anshuiensis TaxID=1608454 RepID=A0A671M7U4_9TELE